MWFKKSKEIERLKQVIRELETEKAELESQINDLKLGDAKLIDVFSSVNVIEGSKGKIVSITNHKVKDWIILYEPNSECEDLKKIGVKLLEQDHKDLILTYSYKKENFDQTIYINYIDVPEDTQLVNRGYGTALLTHLLTIAKKEGIKKVWGSLPITTPQHKERLVHFYQKFDFIVQSDIIKKDL